MRFTIVGAGALGTILGAHLRAAGHPVRMLARGQRAAQLTRDGLVVHGIASLTQPCEVITAPDPARDDDVLVFAVKTYHMADALAATAGLRPVSVFSLANGVMKNEQLTRAFGAGAVLGCMANVSGELQVDGRALFTRNVRLAIGGQEPRASEIAAVIDGAGIHADADPAIETVEWSKFVGWVALFALAVIARTPTGVYLDNPEFARLAVQLIREAAAIATARGIPIVDQSPLPVASIAAAGDDAAAAHVREVGRNLLATAPDHRMSSLQDLDAGRALEVHETLGYAVREAARLGLAAPVLGVAYTIGAGLDALRGT